MRLGTPPPLPEFLGEGDFGFGSPSPKKESLPPLAPESPRKNSRRATHVMPVLSVPTHTGLSTMCALIIVACSIAAWYIHLAITRPLARIFKLIP